MTTGGDSPARYMTCPEAAPAAAAGGGGSSRQQGGRGCSPAGRKLLAGGPRGQAGLLSIPESDRDSEVPESSEQVSSSSSEEEESSSQEEEPAALQDSDCDGEGFAIVGEFSAGAGAAARAAAASTPGRGSERRSSQQQRKPVRRAGRRPASAAAVTPGAPAGGSNGMDADEGEWRVLQLPQVRCVLGQQEHNTEEGSGVHEHKRACVSGFFRVLTCAVVCLHPVPQGSWLRSRGCDTGFTSFFSVTLHQDVWDDAAWQPYLQAGNMLQLRGDIWNVR